MKQHTGLIIAIGLMACAAPTSRPQTPLPSSRSWLTAEDLRGMAPAATLLEAIERLRSEYLAPGRQMTANGSRSYPTVLIDGFVAGGPAALQSIRIDGVKQVQHMSASEARTRLGIRFPGPVILVTRGTGSPP